MKRQRSDDVKPEEVVKVDNQPAHGKKNAPAAAPAESTMTAEEIAQKEAENAANYAKEMEFHAVFETESLGVPRLNISGAFQPMPPDAVPSATPFFSFGSEDTAFVDEAFAAEVDAATGAVTIKIAVIDAQRLIPAADVQPLVENYAAIVEDYFGMYKRAECAFIGRCNRPKCSFSHGPNGPQCHPGNVRCCPPKYKRLGAGLSSQHCRPAIVVSITEGGEKSTAEGGASPTPVVTREWVKLSNDWRLDDKISTESTSSSSSSSVVDILVSFAMRVGGAGRFEGLFDAPSSSSASVLISDTPVYTDYLTVTPADKPFLTKAQYITETMRGLFNEALLTLVRDAKPTAPICCTRVDISSLSDEAKDALAAAGLAATCRSYKMLKDFAVTPALITRTLRHPRHHRLAFVEAEELLPEGIKGCGLNTASFTAPFGSLQSLHNLLLVGRVLDNCANVGVLPRWKSRADTISIRASRIQQKELAAFALVPSSSLHIVGLRSRKDPTRVLLLGPQSITVKTEEAPSNDLYVFQQQ